MGELPKKIHLYSKKDEIGRFFFRVPKYAGCEYKWQRCKADTTEWLIIPNRNEVDLITHINTDLMIGDKYRCLIFENNIVKYYSGVYTIRKNIKLDEYLSVNDVGVPENDDATKQNFEKQITLLLKKNEIKVKRFLRYNCDYKVESLRNKPIHILQCVCASKNINNSESFRAVLTNGIFTRESIQMSQIDNIVLWDRFSLSEMVIQANEANYNISKCIESEKSHEIVQQQSQSMQQEKNNDFFVGCRTEKDYRNRMHQLLQIYHPDHGGSEEITKQIILQYCAYTTK